MIFLEFELSEVYHVIHEMEEIKKCPHNGILLIFFVNFSIIPCINSFYTKRNSFPLQCILFLHYFPLQISRNITTNEVANSMRYAYLKGAGGRFRNPYDLGVKKNCSDFLIYGYVEDPESVEEELLHPRHPEGTGMKHMGRKNSSNIPNNGDSNSQYAKSNDHHVINVSSNSTTNSKPRHAHAHANGHGHGHGHSSHSSHSSNHGKGKNDSVPLGLGLGLGRNTKSVSSSS